jgi:hypothetical protein
LAVATVREKVNVVRLNTIRRAATAHLPSVCKSTSSRRGGGVHQPRVAPIVAPNAAEAV